jgi:hypothetical protein
MDVGIGELRWRETVRPFLAILRHKRSRRFGLGMQMTSGPLAHESPHPGIPLTEEEDALLAFTACGITGYAPPLRTVLGFQVNHVDVEFYDKFYRPEALSDVQRHHLRDWHGNDAGTRGLNRG